MHDTRDGSIRSELSRRLAARSRNTIALRVIPMIDLLFLLLIFFILTSNLTPADDFLPFVLPRVGGAGTSIVEPLVITVRASERGCNARAGQGASAAIDEDDPEAGCLRFAANLESVMRRQKRTAADPVEIVCDEAVEWQYIVKVYDALYGMGINDITFRMTE
jgi:biopolymer transport protein ExbD